MAYSNGTGSKPNAAPKTSPTIRRNYKNRELLAYKGDAAEIVSDMVDLVSKHGGAIMFGLTSDGGAYSVCVLAGSEKIKEYPSSVEELSALHMWLRDEYFAT